MFFEIGFLPAELEQFCFHTLLSESLGLRAGSRSVDDRSRSEPAFLLVHAPPVCASFLCVPGIEECKTNALSFAQM